MSERPARPDTENGSWTDDLLLGQVALSTGPALVRLRLHQSEETYGDHNNARFVPLRHLTGTRSYVHARPYALEPELTLTVGLFPTPETIGGEVVDSAWDGMRHVEIGQAQAWSYPADRLLVRWECYLFDRWHVADPALAALWQGVGATLLARFPAAERIATPAREPLYEQLAWQTFLNKQGYQPRPPSVFVKEFRAHPHQGQSG